MLLNTLSFLGCVALVAAKSQFVGMNIAGFEFGCLIDGTCPLGSAQPPLGVGPSQMQHFVNDDQMNIFRMPVSWQFLVNNQVGATLDVTNLGKYDQLIQACLSTGAYCAIDIHNFARFNGGIIGQGGPTDTQFADLWSQLATKYKGTEKMVFGLMNEPHDLDVPTWANSVQAAVTAIRNAGATAQMILLPGTNFTSAGAFVSSGSGDALIKVTNPDGSTDALILDLHKYLDVNNSGDHPDCTTDNIGDAFAIVAAYLRQKKRLGLVSETGAGNQASSCFTDFCAQNTFLNQNSDVFLGYIAWAAGSFDDSYILGLTPTTQNGKLVDNAMASQCVVAPWLNAGTAIVTSPIARTALKTSGAASSSPLATTASNSEIAKPTSASQAGVSAGGTSSEGASKTMFISGVSTTSTEPATLTTGTGKTVSSAGTLAIPLTTSESTRRTMTIVLLLACLLINAL